MHVQLASVVSLTEQAVQFGRSRTDPSGYVPPRQSPQSAGKFQIIHLRTIAAPGQPFDAGEAKLALDTVQQQSNSLQLQHKTWRRWTDCKHAVSKAKGRGSRDLVFDLRACEAREQVKKRLDLVRVLFKERLEKAPSSATQKNPVRKSTRKTSASGIKSQTKAKTTPAAAPSEKIKRGLTSAERLAEQRYASFASREIIPERSVDLNSEDTWGYLKENPEEARLNFPEELSQAEQTEFDFRGGAGAVATAASVKTVATPETGSQPTETDSPEVEMEELLSDDGEYMADKIQVKVN
ncbi:hypothetical protein Bca52824_065348 [Brassica carinata]|uniref:Uncharacterized protein n=1 Tax=Brassica carinata TaxID=52824 RepID=A0A8X7QJJ2_BRACI|nr:hypothetical protein Bca52824_065348 [Brassica carinata]